MREMELNDAFAYAPFWRIREQIMDYIFHIFHRFHRRDFVHIPLDVALRASWFNVKIRDR